MSDYLDDLQALTEELDQLVDEENALFERRNVPEGQPLVAVEGDPEVVAMVDKRRDYEKRSAAFWEHYSQPGVDPHTISRP